jgi:hypothetical protein
MELEFHINVKLIFSGWLKIVKLLLKVPLKLVEERFIAEIAQEEA